MSDDEEAEQFSLTLTGDGVDLKRGINKRQFAAIIDVVMGRPPMDAASAVPAEVGVDQTPNISLREYLDQVGPSRKTALIVAMGHFINLHAGQPTFSRDDIKMRFAAAKEPMPSNFARDFGAAVKAGMIAEAHQKAGHYYVTQKGVQTLDRRFSVDGKE